ncbi:MAG: hypothetical protein PUA95_08250 [Lactimicrobium massiliense]|nr:hypothetical protein [Lactimicrobium massiliense]MDD6230711.1 hypothetical protein [Lactimicrobium massiliense]
MSRISIDSDLASWTRARNEQIKKAQKDAGAVNSFGRQIKAEMTPKQAAIILRMIDFSVSLGMHLQAIIDLNNKIKMKEETNESKN